MQNKPLEQVRKLTKALIVSGSFNIILLSSIFYWLIKENPPTPYFEKPPFQEEEQQSSLAIDQNNDEVIRQFKSLSRDQLLAMLNNPQLVENGYAQRDLALAVLVSFHHFDLPRALGDMPPKQHRAIVYGQHKGGKPAKVVAYPGLTDEHFEEIIKFANREKWPLTPRGLYLLLRTQNDDVTIGDAFMLTPELLAVELLFSKSEVLVNKNELLKMLPEGNWQMLTTFTHQQKLIQDVSPVRRQAFLMNYIEHGSKTAAGIILKTDGAFSAKKLDDSFVTKMLKLLDVKTPEAEQFALVLLTSPRSDEVWQLAAQRLYEYAGEPKPEKFHHHTAILRFIPEAPGMQKAVQKQAGQPTPTKPIAIRPIPPKRERTYVVQEGDSLWKIARKYNVDVELIKERNGLKSDALKPGTALKLP